MNMQYRFWAQLTVSFKLDNPTFYLLEKCFVNHYDGVVKGCAQHGGFIYGSRNRRILVGRSDHYEELTLTSDQLQLCMKALEMRRYIVQDQLDELTAQLTQLFFAMRKQRDAINETLLAPGGEI